MSPNGHPATAFRHSAGWRDECLARRSTPDLQSADLYGPPDLIGPTSEDPARPASGVSTLHRIARRAAPARGTTPDLQRTTPDLQPVDLRGPPDVGPTRYARDMKSKQLDLPLR